MSIPDFIETPAIHDCRNADSGDNRGCHTRIVFYDNDYDTEKTLSELTDMFCDYLLKDEYK